MHHRRQRESHVGACNEQAIFEWNEHENPSHPIGCRSSKRGPILLATNGCDTWNVFTHERTGKTGEPEVTDMQALLAMGWFFIGFNLTALSIWIIDRINQRLARDHKK